MRPLSLNNLNYLPSGPTTTIFALLAQYHATIPYIFRYRIGTTSSSNTATTNSNSNSNGNGNSNNTGTGTGPSTPKPPPPSLTLLLSDKSTTYLIAAQLALSQFPASLLPAITGWVISIAWRAELLPGLSPASAGFRIPAWLVGERERRGGAASAAAEVERERFEDMRRRLEGEAEASGLEGAAPGQRRRNGGNEGGLAERLRGAW